MPAFKTNNNMVYSVTWAKATKHSMSVSRCLGPKMELQLTTILESAWKPGWLRGLCRVRGLWGREWEVVGDLNHMLKHLPRSVLNIYPQLIVDWGGAKQFSALRFWWVVIATLYASVNSRSAPAPPPPGVGTHKLSKCSGVGTKKEGKRPTPDIVAFPHFCRLLLISE